jgi:hypothetical protein
VPDVTGQPTWVVIVLAALTLIGTVSVATITARTRKSATQDGEAQATLSEGGKVDTSVVVLQAALDHLARVAEREAAESDEARKETATLRGQLERTMGQLHEAHRRADQAEAALATCRAHAELLSQQAMRRGRDD